MPTVPRWTKASSPSPATSAHHREACRYTGRNRRLAPPEGVAELYADGPDLMMAESFAPPHRAEEVPGGYRVTGRGPLASTMHDSRWALMSAIVFDGDQPRMTPAGPDFISVVMRTTDVEIIDTWDSLGMRGTDSNDIEANDVFVPDSRAFRFEPDSLDPVDRQKGKASQILDVA